MRIALREHRDEREEFGTYELPLASRSLSVDSIRTLDPNDYEASMSSSRSSQSGMTHVSANTNGQFIRDKSNASSRSSVSHIPSGRLRKGYSTPDIHALGKMMCEVNMKNRQSQKQPGNRSSQRSIQSVYNVPTQSRYQVFDIPFEKRLQQQALRTERFTAGFSGTCTDKAYRGSTRSVRTLPGNRSFTRALVHSPSPSVDSQLVRTPKNRSLRSLRFSIDHEPTHMTIYEQPNIGQRQPSKKQKATVTTDQSANNKDGRTCEQPIVNLTHDKEFRVSINKSKPEDSALKPATPANLVYQDPMSFKQQTILSQNKPPKPMPKPQLDAIYSKVAKPKIQHPKPKLNRNNIYATVNKSMIKLTTDLTNDQEIKTQSRPQEATNIKRVSLEQKAQPPNSDDFEIYGSCSFNDSKKDKSKLWVSDNKLSPVHGIDNQGFEIYGTCEVVGISDDKSFYQPMAGPTHVSELSNGNLEIYGVPSFTDIYTSDSTDRINMSTFGHPDFEIYGSYQNTTGGLQSPMSPGKVRKHEISKIYSDSMEIYATCDAAIKGTSTFTSKHTDDAGPCVRHVYDADVTRTMTQTEGGMELEDDEADSALPEVKEEVYARMETFMPFKPIFPITIEGLSNAASNI